MPPKKYLRLGDWKPFSRSRSKSPNPEQSTRPVSYPPSSTSPTTLARISQGPPPATGLALIVASPLLYSDTNSDPNSEDPATATPNTPPKHVRLPVGPESHGGKTENGEQCHEAEVAALIPPLPTPNAADEIFREKLESYNKSLCAEQRKAFLRARDMSATELISTITSLNQQHSEKSNARKCVSRVQGFLEVADMYLKALEICIQQSPQISSLVVGGLRLFVDFGRRYAGFFDSLSETMERLEGHLKYLAKYAELYGHYREVKEALCGAYGDLLDFCKISCGIFMGEDGQLSGKISAKLLLKQLSTPLETRFEVINSRFDEHLGNIEKTASVLEQRRKIFKESLEAREKSVLDRGRLLSWLSKLEPEEDHDRIYAKRHHNTGKWFSESAEVENWFAINKSCLLWCHGNPGVGKSVLVSILLGDVISRHIFDDHIGIAFFYFNFQNEMAQKPADVLSVLIKQLCRRKKRIPQSLRELYDQCTYNDKAPKLAELQAQFLKIIDTFEEVFLVIDAMDECNKDYREQFLPYIVKLFQESSGRLKVFVASRPEKDIERAFRSEKFETIRIEAKKVDEDIKTYVRHELVHRHDYYHAIDEDLRGEIENVLVSRAGGMFLWVRCQLDYLYTQPSKNDIRDALKSLPIDMTETYHRILARIQNQSAIMKAIAKRALTWVITAKRPLTPEELAIAIAIEPTSNSVEDLIGTYTPQVFIDACCGLLTIENLAVRPIHFTVQEFLKGSDIDIGNEVDANAELARSSVQYMLCKEFVGRRNYSMIGTELCPRLPREVAPVSYMFWHWDHHIRSVPLPLPSDLGFLLERFLGSKNCLTAYVARVGCRIGGSALGLCAAVDLLPVYGQFHLASLDELKQAIRNAVKKGAVSAINTLLGLLSPADVQDCYLLRLAAEAGHRDAVQLLLDHGADVNARENNAIPTALYTAASFGREDIVEMLLESGADTNIRDKEFGTALQVACRGGGWMANIPGKGRRYEKIVETLLSHGADVNIQCGWYGTALQAAASGGHKTIVESLFLHGADVNIQCGWYGIALQAAASGGHEKIVESLLSYGADVNIQSGEYGTALQAAASGGHGKIVESLLSHGADVNIRGGRYGTALQAAAYGGHETVVKSLLSHGTDVNVEDGKYGTALQAAASGGHEKIVESLLSHGADVNIRGGKYGTALQAAAYGGYETIVKSLLSHGTDVNVEDGKYGTALQTAAYRDYKNIVETLLSNGADVNIQGGVYGTALQAAVSGFGNRSRHDNDIIGILLDKGADVNSKGGRHGSALAAAREWRRADAIKLLLERGAKDITVETKVTDC